MITDPPVSEFESPKTRSHKIFKGTLGDEEILINPTPAPPKARRAANP